MVTHIMAFLGLLITLVAHAGQDSNKFPPQYPRTHLPPQYPPAQKSHPYKLPPQYPPSQNGHIHKLPPQYPPKSAQSEQEALKSLYLGRTVDEIVINYIAKVVDKVDSTGGVHGNVALEIVAKNPELADNERIDNQYKYIIIPGDKIHGDNLFRDEYVGFEASRKNPSIHIGPANPHNSRMVTHKFKRLSKR